MGATLGRSVAIGQRAIASSAGPPLRRGALRGAHGNPGRARALAWNRVCGAIGFEFYAGRGFGALLKILAARSHFIELRTGRQICLLLHPPASAVHVSEPRPQSGCAWAGSSDGNVHNGAHPGMPGIPVPIGCSGRCAGIFVFYRYELQPRRRVCAGALCV